jgi:hypothetical protein
LLERRQDHLQHAIRVLKHIVVPESEHKQTFSLEKRGASAVLRHLIRMLAAVQLNDQTALPAQEIADEWTNRHLAAEFETAEAPKPQMAP